MNKTKLILLFFLLLPICLAISGQGLNVISVKGTRFEMNGAPFEYTGISFFNAIYNKAFNESSEIRRKNIKIFKEHGINVLRIWCQWDNPSGYIDSGKDKTLYNEDGTLKPELLSRLKSIITDADKEGVVVLLVLFARESWDKNIRLTDKATEKALNEITQELKPHSNLIFQIWNEFDYRTVDYFKIIKQIDATRLVTNSPGFEGVLGSDEENKTLDFLSPHTSRNDNIHLELAAEEIKLLIQKYQKPVVDDEPARRGTPLFGGPKVQTLAYDHIIQIYNVWKAGGYIIYHHDMFQTGYGSGAVPVNGIPVPGFSPYHDQVFDFLKNKTNYVKSFRK